MTASGRVRAAVGLPLLVLLCLSLWTPGSSAATARNVPTQKEAWYQASPADPGEEDPTCALPTGCLPQPGAPVNPYPEGTLQVGVAGGRDTARTFVALDLSDLPTGALISGGTLTLPVMANSESGSLRPEAARVMACPVAAPIEESHGGQPDDQPDFSCDTAAEGTFNKGGKPSITVDLSPIAALMTTGGIAIVPAAEARESGDTWRVAFPTRDNDSVEEAITATLNYEEPATLDAGLPAAPPPPPAANNTGGAGSVSTGGGFEPAPAAEVAPPAFDEMAPAAAPPNPGPEQPIAAPEPVAAAVPAVAFGYAYPALWLAPLVLAGVAGALARSLTGEIVLPDPGEEGVGPAQPNLVERLLAALHPPAPQQPPAAT